MEKRLFKSRLTKYFIIFAVSLAVGTVFVNLSKGTGILHYGIMKNIHTEISLPSRVSFKRQFSYIVSRRLPALIIVILASMTPFRKVFAVMICSYAGLASGIVSSSLTMAFGTRYFAIFPAAVLFHMMFYGYGIYGMFSKEVTREPSEFLRVMRTVTAWGIGAFAETLATYYILPKVLHLW